MINNITFLSKQIALNALDEFLDELEKEKPGDELTKIRRLSDNKQNYITIEGKPISRKWFDFVGDFHEGKAKVEEIKREQESRDSTYNYLRLDGTLLSDTGFNWPWCGDFSDGWGQVSKDTFINDKMERMTIADAGHVNSFHFGRAEVWNKEEYYFIDTDGKRIGNNILYGPGSYSFAPQIPTEYIDGFALVRTHKYGEVKLMDLDGNILPEQDGDEVVPLSYRGCGYYLVGQRNKMRGIKLKDANTGIVLDYYQSDVPNYGYQYQFITNAKEAIKHAAVSMSAKRMPIIWPGFREIVKDNGVMLIGNYWFLGPSNLKVTKKGLNYLSHSPFGDFVTKYPPIKAIDNQFIFCAHNDQVIIFDSYHNEYYKTCSRKEIEEHIRKREEKRILNKLGRSVQSLKEFEKNGIEALLVLDEKEQEIYDSLCLEANKNSRKTK